MTEILKESTEAHKYTISLKHVEYSGDLVEKMQKHASKLEKIYSALHELQKRGVKSTKRYRKFFDIADEMHAWYQKAEAARCFKACFPIPAFLRLAV